MRNGNYGLGVDVGESTVAAAVCRWDGDLRVAAALPLADPWPTGLAAVELAADGPVRFANRGDAPRTEPARHVMARVGTPDPLHVGGHAIPAADAAAAILTLIREVATAQEGEPPAWTVVAVPPSWGPHRRACLVEALEAACPDVSLVSSAVAAAQHHMSSAEVAQNGTVAVYDLGASTLDLALVGHADDGGLRHLAVPPPPLPWGGGDIDDALLAHVLRGVERPTDGDPAVPLAFPAGLRGRVVAAKEALAADTATCVDLPLPTGPVRVTRDELEDLLAERIEDSVVRMAAVITDAGLGAEDVDAVVLAGGSARLPLVAERLSAGLGLPVVVDPAPELAVALGAAGLAAALPADHDVPASAPDEPAATERGPAAAHVLVRASTSRPPRSPAGRPRGASRPSGDPRGRHRTSRALIVAVMFLGLVGVTSSLIAVVSDVRTAPAAQGQTPAVSPAAGDPVPAADGGVAPSASPDSAAAASPDGTSGRTAAESSGGTTTPAGTAPGTAAATSDSPTAAAVPDPPAGETTTPPPVPPPVVDTPTTTPPEPTTPSTPTPPSTTPPDPTTPVPDPTTEPPQQPSPDATPGPTSEPTADAGTGQAGTAP